MYEWSIGSRSRGRDWLVFIYKCMKFNFKMIDEAGELTKQKKKDALFRYFL